MRSLLAILGVSCLASSAAAYSLAPISGRIISHAPSRAAVKHKLLIRLGCIKSSFGAPKSCGEASAEAVIGSDGTFQTPALSVSGFFPTQYNAYVQLISDDAPDSPVVDKTYFGIDISDDYMSRLVKDLKSISIYAVPRIQLVFSLKSGGPVEDFIRGPRFRDRYGLLPFWVDAVYKIGAKSIGMGKRDESWETPAQRRPLDRYFVGGELVYAAGVDAPPWELSVDLASYLGQTSLIDQACPAASPCRVTIDDVAAAKP